MPDEVAASSPAQNPGRGRPLPEQELDPVVKRETLELVRAYYKIGEPGVRKRPFEMTPAHAVASGGKKAKPDDRETIARLASGREVWAGRSAEERCDRTV